MKKITFFFLLICPTCLLAQDFKPDNNTASDYSDMPAYLLDTILTTSLSKKELYSNTLNYIVSTFKDSRDVIEFKDLELGEIAYKGIVSTTFKTVDTLKAGKKQNIIVREKELRLHFNCKVFVKDGKCKIILSGLKWTVPITGMNDITNTLRIKNTSFDPKGNIIARELAKELINSISKKAISNPNNDF